MKQRVATPQEAAELLKVSDRKIRSMIRSGELPGFRLGAEYRVDLERLEEVLAGERPTS